MSGTDHDPSDEGDGRLLELRAATDTRYGCSLGSST